MKEEKEKAKRKITIMSLQATRTYKIFVRTNNVNGVLWGGRVGAEEQL